MHAYSKEVENALVVCFECFHFIIIKAALFFVHMNTVSTLLYEAQRR